MTEEDKVIMYREFERTFQHSSLLVLHRCKRGEGCPYVHAGR